MTNTKPGAFSVFLHAMGLVLALKREEIANAIRDTRATTALHHYMKLLVSLASLAISNLITAQVSVIHVRKRHLRQIRTQFNVRTALIFLLAKRVPFLNPTVNARRDMKKK